MRFEVLDFLDETLGKTNAISFSWTHNDTYNQYLSLKVKHIQIDVT